MTSCVYRRRRAEYGQSCQYSGGRPPVLPTSMMTLCLMRARHNIEEKVSTFLEKAQLMVMLVHVAGRVPAMTAIATR
jgi:hypothetical protein